MKNYPVVKKSSIYVIKSFVFNSSNSSQIVSNNRTIINFSKTNYIIGGKDSFKLGKLRCQRNQQTPKQAIKNFQLLFNTDQNFFTFNILSRNYESKTIGTDSNFTRFSFLSLLIDCCTPWKFFLNCFCWKTIFITLCNTNAFQRISYIIFRKLLDPGSNGPKIESILIIAFLSLKLQVFLHLDGNLWYIKNLNYHIQVTLLHTIMWIK